MIGKGAQYLKAAGFGRYRITAASLGSLDLLGTFSWLKGPAVQAIMAAFGVDGPAVIRATNEYLNGIAASDKAKATALAGFINEDPMMVCSLGLEPQGVTMPIRLCIGDGNSWIVTSHAIGTHPRIVIEGYYCTLGNACIFQPIANGAAQVVGWVTNPDGSMYYRYGSASWNGTRSMGTITGQRMNLDLSEHMIRDGVEYGNAITGYDFTSYKDYNLRLWGAGWEGSRTIEMGRIKLYDDTEQYLELIPYKHPTQGNGMLDLVNVVFYPNAGTGQFTIPDISYTPTP